MPSKHNEAELLNQIERLQQRVVELEEKSLEHNRNASKLQAVNEALRESEERFRRYFDLGLIGMITSTLEKNWLQVNDRVCEILGYSREEMVQMTWAEMTHPDDLKADVEQFNRVISGEINGYSMDKRFIRKNGEVVYASISVTCVRKENGAIDRFLAFVSDITERKLAAEAHEKLQAQLHQAQKMESVGRLAGGVAHDFNNMLSVISGYAELAMSNVNSPDSLHTYLEEIIKAAKRSAEVTRQLLAFARKQTTSPSVLNLNDNVEDMLKMLRRLIGEDIELIWLPNVHLFPVKVDPSQLDQILANLCINARDAIVNVGKITIKTDEVSLDEDYCALHIGRVPGKYIKLSVSDNGKGIDKSNLDNIFEPFFTTKDAGSGTGLGLATVYGAVEQNNGFIDVCSNPGKGCTFEIYFPPCLDPVVEDEEVKSPNSDRGCGETILVVEDEVAILILVKEVLKEVGYRVLTANSPTEAMHLIHKYKDEVSLLITDVIMPEVNGRDLSTRLQSLNPNLKCLYMSGYPSDVLSQRGVLEDNINFIQKPFTNNELVVKVRQVITNS